MVFEVDFGGGTCEYRKGLKDIADKFNSMKIILMHLYM